MVIKHRKFQAQMRFYIPNIAGLTIFILKGNTISKNFTLKLLIHGTALTYTCLVNSQNLYKGVNYTGIAIKWEQLFFFSKDLDVAMHLNTVLNRSEPFSWKGPPETESHCLTSPGLTKS